VQDAPSRKSQRTDTNTDFLRRHARKMLRSARQSGGGDAWLSVIPPCARRDHVA